MNRSLFVGSLAVLSALDLHCAVIDTSSGTRSRQTPSTSVFGLIAVRATESSRNVSPLLTSDEVAGGVGFDDLGRTVFSANFAGSATAWDLGSGEQKWAFTSPEALSMPPLYLARQAAVPRALVIEGSQSGRLTALDARSGTPVWAYDFGGELRQRPLVAGGRLIVTNSRNQCAALDPATGKWLWQYSREFPSGLTIFGHSGASVQDDKIFLGSSDGYVSAVRLEDGAAVWVRPLTLKGQGFSDADATPEPIGDKVIAASFEDGVYALKSQNGEVAWQAPLPGVTHVTVHDPYVYVASTAGFVAALDVDLGHVVWKFNFPQAVVTKPISHRGYVVFGTSPGGLYVLQEDSGEPVQALPVEGVLGELALSSNVLGLMSDSHWVYVLRYGETGSPFFAYPHPFVGL